MPEITDEQLIAKLTEWGSNQMTYVVANSLRMDGYKGLKTDYVRRRLEKLERAGRVKRVPSIYARMICWAPA